MASEKKDFYGKEVTDAIKKACDELGVPQEQLDIEVVETGSTGIFGLIRKKARIRVSVKEGKPEIDEVVKEVVEEQVLAEPVKEVAAESKSAEGSDVPPAASSVEPKIKEETVQKQDRQAEVKEELSEEAVEQIKQELEHLLGLMGYPSSVEITAEGTSVVCKVGEEFEEILTGQDGKTLDSIQYLLRKMVARKILSRIRLTVDVGNYREKRLVDLKSKALELAETVKTDGKTQVIPALSPSERRVVHMSLQDDKEIRSRSVGDGLFKKILIYKPGKGNKGGGRKRSNPRGRRGNNSRKKSE